MKNTWCLNMEIVIMVKKNQIRFYYEGECLPYTVYPTWEQALLHIGDMNPFFKSIRIQPWERQTNDRQISNDLRRQLETHLL